MLINVFFLYDTLLVNLYEIVTTLPCCLVSSSCKRTLRFTFTTLGESWSWLPPKAPLLPGAPANKSKSVAYRHSPSSTREAVRHGNTTREFSNQKDSLQKYTTRANNVFLKESNPLIITGNLSFSFFIDQRQNKFILSSLVYFIQNKICKIRLLSMVVFLQVEI